MQIKKKINSLNKLYIIFFSSVLFINIFFVEPINANIFKITDIEITEPFELNFNREKVIDKGFKRAFIQLMSTIVNSNDKKKIENTPLLTIKTLIDSFTMSDENFINDQYQSKFHVNFNKKNTLIFLENKNIFPSIPKKKELLLIPVLVDIQKNKISLFSENIFYKKWNEKKEKFFLLDYLLPSEDLDDLKIISQNSETIEDFDFKEIIKKYDIDDFIVTIIYKNNHQIKILSKIRLDKLFKINNKVFSNIDINSDQDVDSILMELKNTYENYWKKVNQINTSIKLSLTVSVNSKSINKIQNFENNLSQMDLVSSYDILKFDNQNIYFKVIYNGSPKKFLDEMKKRKIIIERQTQSWKII